jgi:alkylation response protein AidB-like acyl-CoA dehydrogenase
MDDVLREIREAVARLCEDFPGEYWRRLDRERAYPSEFVAALSESGFLGILIPEAFGGSGLGVGAACAVLEQIHMRRRRRSFGRTRSRPRRPAVLRAR